MLCDLKLKIKYAFTGIIKSKFAPKSVFTRKLKHVFTRKQKSVFYQKVKACFYKEAKVCVLPES